MLWQIKSRLRGYKVLVQQPPNGFHLHTDNCSKDLSHQQKTKENGKLFECC